MMPLPFLWNERSPPETYAHSFSEVRSQLEDAFYNVELIQIQFVD